MPKGKESPEKETGVPIAEQEQETREPTTYAERIKRFVESTRERVRSLFTRRESVEKTIKQGGEEAGFSEEERTALDDVEHGAEAVVAVAETLATPDDEKHENLSVATGPLAYETEGAADYYALMMESRVGGNVQTKDSPHNAEYFRKFAAAEARAVWMSANIKNRALGFHGWSSGMETADKNVWEKKAEAFSRIAEGEEGEESDVLVRAVKNIRAGRGEMRGGSDYFDHIRREVGNYEIEIPEDGRLDRKSGALARLDGFWKAALEDGRVDLAYKAFNTRRSFRPITRNAGSPGATIQYKELSSDELGNPRELNKNKTLSELVAEKMALEEIQKKATELYPKGQEGKAAIIYRDPSESNGWVLQNVERKMEVYEKAFDSRGTPL